MTRVLESSPALRGEPSGDASPLPSCCTIVQFAADIPRFLTAANTPWDAARIRVPEAMRVPPNNRMGLTVCALATRTAPPAADAECSPDKKDVRRL